MEAIFLGIELTQAQKSCAEMYAIGSISIEDVLWYLNLNSKDKLPEGFFDYVDAFYEFVDAQMRITAKQNELNNK